MGSKVGAWVKADLLGSTHLTGRSWAGLNPIQSAYKNNFCGVKGQVTAKRMNYLAESATYSIGGLRLGSVKFNRYEKTGSWRSNLTWKGDLRFDLFFFSPKPDLEVVDPT